MLGDGPPLSFTITDTDGCCPLAWGWSLLRGDEEPALGLLPVRAGMVQRSTARDGS
ncbi:hypothetical protein ACGFYP_34065 [Streptomyces sp. NPDC048370]|uniref:hypothetical protein n=1 Tax=Streptomyces sp. NPDC048370 TaxID=3365540 RepID=UPI0037106CE2